MSNQIILSRRAFGLASAVACCGAVAAAKPLVTAEQIALRMSGAAQWDTDGSGFVAGDPRTVVRSIAVTAMPNLPGLRRAVAHGCNMVVSVELPLYGRLGDPPQGSHANAARLQDDPTYRAKQAFIADHGLAIYRLNNARGANDPLVGGLAAVLGWQRFSDRQNAGHYTVPDQALSKLTSHIKRRLGLNGGMRVIGKPDHHVSRVLVVPGRIDPVVVVRQLPQVDVLLAGDLREWELVEYIADSWETARPKALIAVGRIMSEQPGMLAAASWLRSIAGVPVTPLSVDDPYWRLPA